MDDRTRKRMAAVEQLANADPAYNQMLGELRQLERKYEIVLQSLTREQMNDVCDFVSMCEEMSWRMLELACTHMVFPE